MVNFVQCAVKVPPRPCWRDPKMGGADLALVAGGTASLSGVNSVALTSAGGPVVLDAPSNALLLSGSAVSATVTGAGLAAGGAAGIRLSSRAS